VNNRWVVIALTASLAVNVFLGGMFVGRQMVVPPPPPLGPAAQQQPAWRPGDRALPPFIERITAGMAPQDRAVFDGTMEKHRPEIMAAGMALRLARAKIREMLGAEEFNHAAAETAMGELREKNSEFQRTLQAALLEAADGLSLDGRRRIMNPTPGRRPPDSR
jgi:uncharacterized membrane protein